MEHVAIMRKSWKLTEKIITGEKKIESRWYKSKYSPWNKIKKEDAVYFKDSGDRVSIKAEVEKIIQFSNLNSKRVKEILNQYGRDDGIKEKDLNKFYEIFKDKKYCILIFLKNSKKIEQFDIDKRGFGNMASWISVEDVNKIRKQAKAL